MEGLGLGCRPVLPLRCRFLLWHLDSSPHLPLPPPPFNDPVYPHCLLDSGSGEAHQRAVSTESRRLLASLTSQHTSAVAALHSAHDRLAAQLAAQRDTTLQELHRAYEGKVAALSAVLTAARSGVAELATVTAAAEGALAAGVDPVLKVDKLWFDVA